MLVSITLFRPRVGRTQNVKGKIVKKTVICQYWHTQWTDPQTGRRRSLATGTTNKQSAQVFATKLQDKLYRQAIGAYNPAEEYTDMQFSAARDEFLIAKKQRLRPDSVEAYAFSLLAFERLMRPKELRKTDERTIDRFVTKRAAMVSAETVNKDLRQIRAFFNWCKRASYIARTIDFKGQFLALDKAEPLWVADADVQAVVKALNDSNLVLTKRSADWWRVFIRTALFTGMRRSELLGLRWTDVDFEAGMVRVRRQTSKGRRDRTYEGAHALTAMLKEWYELQLSPPKATDKVLSYDRNPRGLYTDWGRILKHAEIPSERRFTPHDCRSSCVSELLAQGVAITSVRDWVGHASIATTAAFYAATRSDRREIAEKRGLV